MVPLSGDAPPSPELLQRSTQVHLGRVREVHVWDKEADTYYALVEVRETLKGPPAELAGVLISRWHCRPGLCPCGRLERPGDRVIVYHVPMPENRSEPSLMFMERFGDHGAAYVRGLRAFARELPGYKAPARERPVWWRGAGDAFPAVRD